jgi:hypothetical protein
MATLVQEDISRLYKVAVQIRGAIKGIKYSHPAQIKQKELNNEDPGIIS